MRAGVIALMALAFTGLAGASASAVDTGSAGPSVPGAPGAPQDGPPAPPDGQHVGDPCTAGGGAPGHYAWVHLDGSAAEHYGTEWMWVCQAN
ncbi:hypothetical protein [Nocardia sp. BMG51109]|uniref:hypothetical protein n=1 Tax=Nocardia sp. BMG51109 TaxID=1056816 RepID=UPI0012EC2BB5|nr:hypothetical protein [Nocardia sp. BMG51109]